MQDTNNSENSNNFMVLMFVGIFIFCCSYIILKIIKIFGIDYILDYNLHTGTKWDDNFNEVESKSFCSKSTESNLMEKML